MDIQMGSHIFRQVDVPVLWGTRAILQDKRGRLSVIDLSGPKAIGELIGDEPAPDVEFAPTADGFKVIRDGETLYVYSKTEKTITSVSLKLPTIQIQKHKIRVGSNIFQDNIISGSGVGLGITENSVSIATPLPKELARLVV